MGWSSGSILAREIWDLVHKYVEEDNLEELAINLARAFEDMDCDTLDEVPDLYRLAYPTCFVSGHLDLTQEEFDEHYVPLLDKYMSRRWCRFVIGDARGADLMAQQYLYNHRYDNVRIFHMFDDAPRNCVDPHWHCHSGYLTDEERDAAMTAASDIDIAWVRPGRESSGTAKNLERRKIKEQS